MPDISSISAAITSLSSAIDIVKFINGSRKTLKEAEVNLKLSETMTLLTKSKTELAVIEELLTSKEREIAELKRKLEIKQQITWDDPYYWLGSKEENNGPFCQAGAIGPKV